MSRLIAYSSPAAVRHTVIALKSGGDLKETIEAAGGTVTTLRLGFSPSGLLHLWDFVRMIGQLKPDVIQGWMAHANVLAWIARTLASRSSALAWNLRTTVRDLGPEARSTRVLTRLAAACSPFVDLLISNSSAALAEHGELGYRPRASAIVPNGFDASIFRPDADARRQIRASLSLREEDVVFGLVGRFHPAKGHRGFVSAAAIVAERSAEARFVLVGRSVVDNPVLASWLDATGIAHRFTLLGETQSVQDIVRAFDVACAPSLYEGFPNAVGEAMASATPCVATAVSDVPAILQDGGLIVPPNDVGALSEAMITMIEMGDAGRRETGARGRARIIDCYTIDRVTSRYEELYRSLKRRRSG